MFEPFLYDFGYSWPYLLTHPIIAVVCGGAAILLWRRGWARWIAVVLAAVAAWALVVSVVIHYVFDFNRPMRLPTAAFQPPASGHVLDIGAGSGRTTVMILRERPGTTVTSLDVYGDQYFGIEGNSADRLRANARVAGVADRVQVHVSDMRKIDLPSASFDAAVSAYAIDHIPPADVPTALGEVARLVKPRGQFLLMIINVDGWLRLAAPWMNMHGGNRTAQRARRWRDWLEGAGFEVVEQTTSPGSLNFLAQTRVGA